MKFLKKFVIAFVLLFSTTVMAHDSSPKHNDSLDGQVFVQDGCELVFVQDRLYGPTEQGTAVLYCGSLAWGFKYSAEDYPIVQFQYNFEEDYYKYWFIIQECYPRKLWPLADNPAPMTEVFYKRH